MNLNQELEKQEARWNEQRKEIATDKLGDNIRCGDKPKTGVWRGASVAYRGKTGVCAQCGRY